MQFLPCPGSRFRRSASLAAYILALLAVALLDCGDAAGKNNMSGQGQGQGQGRGSSGGGTYIAPTPPAEGSSQQPAGDSGKPAISLDEAQRITAAAESQPIVAPPRTITDITAVLDREKPDPAKVAAARAVAEKEPPQGLDAAGLARFYYERGTAAGQLGRSVQELADYRKAAELIEPLKESHADEYLQYANALAVTETHEGHIRDAIALHEKLVGFATSTPHVLGSAVREYDNLTADNIRLGDMAAAGAWLAKFETLVTTTPWKGRALSRLNVFRSRYDWAKALYLKGEGKYAEAEGYFRRALAENIAATEDSKKWDVAPAAGAMETASDFIMRDHAVNLTLEGRLIAAEIEARRALMDQLRMRGRYANETTIVLTTLGSVIAAQGRSAEAEKLQRVAIDTYVALGHAPNSLPLDVARRGLAASLVAEGRWAAALEQYDLIRQGAAGDAGLLRAFLGRNLDFAAAALHGGRAPAALEVSQHALDGRSKALGDKHYGTAEARGFHAMALAATGNKAAALADYAAAVPILLQASRQSSSDESEDTGQGLRLQQILEGYLELLAEARGGEASGSVAEAFRVADAARGRTVQKALAASATRAAVGDPALADLVRREQDAQHRIAGANALISNILLMASDQQDAQAVDALRKEIDQLRGARATIRAEIEKRFPDYINLIDPKPATVAEAQATLEPGEALIATYVGEERGYVWAVPKEGPVAFAVVPLKRSEVEAMVARLRKALEPNPSTLGDIPPFDVALAYKLYSLILKPVEAGWKGAKRLLVVSHGALGQLPLGLLVTSPASLERDKPDELMFSSYRKVPWLIREVAVAELPSVASLAALRAARAAGEAAKPFIGFGDPWFNAKEAAEALGEAKQQVAALESRGVEPALATRGVPLHRRSVPQTAAVNKAVLAMLPRLPETAEEVREVAVALKADPQADVFLGARASEKTVTTMRLDDRRVIMFATHGLVPGDLDGLAEPALALSAPQLAGGGGDGLLKMSDILGLKLNADWVVLSACNTAAGNGVGAEAVSGLGLAFFYAGTRALLVTNWPVETSSARALTTTLFRREAESRGLPRAEALREAMLALIDGPGLVEPGQSRSLFSYAHPIFWAPFSLVGEGGGALTH